MARVECRLPNKPKIPSVWVKIDGITNDQVKEARAYLDALCAKEGQISDAVAQAYIYATEIAPTANPSDLWQHVIYRHLLAEGWSDNTWKRVSGFALERALVGLFAPRLAPYGLRMRILSANEANALLDKLGIVGIRATKIDMFSLKEKITVNG